MCSDVQDVKGTSFIEHNEKTEIHGGSSLADGLVSSPSFLVD